jgi:hypothetical protein
MKRPPKVKSAAAAARNAAGAGSGPPDFYRISAIAPLPPATPFRPVAQESKGDDDDSPKYSIETLSLDDAGETLEEMSTIGWSAQQSSEATSLPFSDPFEEDSPTSGIARSRKAEGIDHSGTSRQEAQRGQRGSVSAQTGTDLLPSLETSSKDAAMSNAETVTEAHAQKLSKADLNYLAHQNQILMLHVEKDSEGAKVEVDKP